MTPSMKGITLSSVRDFVRERFGAAGFEQLTGTLDVADRQVFTAALAVGWYPAAAVSRINHALDRTLGRGDLTLIDQLGRYQAEHDLNLIFRFLLRFGSPATVVEKAGEYWSRYHDSGTWHIQRRGDSSVVGRLRDFGGAEESICRGTTAYIGRLIELVGGKEVRCTHTECRTRNGSHCTYDVSWR